MATKDCPTAGPSWAPHDVSPQGFFALGLLCRAVLDYCISEREHLLARGILISSYLCRVDRREYVLWLNKANHSENITDDTQLMLALDGAGDEASYLLQRELRKHPIWTNEQVWESAISDAILRPLTAATAAEAEKELPQDVARSLTEAFGDNMTERQRDLHLGQAGLLARGMLMGLSTEETKRALSRCLGLGMELSRKDERSLLACVDAMAEQDA